MSSLDEVLDLYRRWGTEHYDEDLAQLDHALQCAALAAADGAADVVVVAALLHDIGHLLELRGDDPAPHERAGPTFLAGLFPDAVIAPIALHVEAKRYLCAVESRYADLLSSGSTHSLRRQGGPMTAAEIERFESTAGWADAVALRRWDDRGKVDGLDVPDLDSHLPILEAVSCSGS